VSKKWFDDAEVAIVQEQTDMSISEKAGLKTRKPVTIFEGRLKAIGDSLSDPACSGDEVDGEAEEDDE